MAICGYCFGEVAPDAARTRTEIHQTKGRADRTYSSYFHGECFRRVERIEEMGREFEARFPSSSIRPARVETAALGDPA